ncbi:hypothetical protein, partial [Sphingobacterium multivorum]|uniref:hypothetical protein n=1 Tax=Sphingobacterium multivorum TaxID=28454 RepID=UPI003DA2846C
FKLSRSTVGWVSLSIQWGKSLSAIILSACIASLASFPHSSHRTACFTSKLGNSVWNTIILCLGVSLLNAIVFDLSDTRINYTRG